MKLFEDTIMEDKNYYTSGQFAKMANVSTRTIRFYDQKGLLKPSRIEMDRGFTQMPILQDYSK